MSKKDDRRFQVIFQETEGVISSSRVLRDTQTNVCYFYHVWGYGGGGMTPLLDKDGKPVIDAKEYDD